MSATETQTFDAAYVKELRDEAARYRTRAHAAETTLSVYINKYPLGDVENFHVSRAAMAKALSGGRLEGPAWDKYAEYEKGWLEAERKAQGDQVSGADGGFLAPEDWNRTWIDLLRSKSALDQLSIRRMTIPARVAHIPRVIIDPTISYPGENSAPTATAIQTQQMSYNAHKAVALLNVSNELIRDAADLADDVFRQVTSGAIATDRDTQLFVGQSTGGALTAAAPTGLINHPIINNNFTWYPNTSVSGAISQTAASFTPSYQHVAQLIAKVEVLFGFTNVNVGQAVVNGAVTNPQFKQTLWSSSRFQTATTAQPLWVDDINARAGFFGMKWALSNVIPTNLSKGGGSANESVIILGDWRQYLLVECLQPAYDATPLSGSGTVGFGANQTQIRVVHRYDGGPVHPEAFGVLAGVLV